MQSPQLIKVGDLLLADLLLAFAPAPDTVVNYSHVTPDVAKCFAGGTIQVTVNPTLSLK